MRWRRRRDETEPGRIEVEGVMLLTTSGGRFSNRVDEERGSLDDPETVRRWIRGFRSGTDQQVHLRRAWGSIAAVNDGEHPVTVVLADGDDAWSAEPPAGSAEQDLTLEQVERLVLEALSSPERPCWPIWRPLT